MTNIINHIMVKMEKMSMRYWESVEERTTVLNEIQEANVKLIRDGKVRHEHEMQKSKLFARKFAEEDLEETEKGIQNNKCKILECIAQGLSCTEFAKDLSKLENKKKRITRELVVLHKNWLRWYISTQ